MLKSKHIQRQNGNPRALYSLLGLLLALLLNACATSTPVETVQPSLPDAGSPTAAALMQQAGRAPADAAAALYLQAAWAYLESTTADAPDQPIAGHAGAERAYAMLEPGWLATELLPDYQLLSATLAIHRGDLEAAGRAMDSVPLENRRSTRGLNVSSALCEAEGDFSCALEDRIAAAGDDPSYNEQIWRLLHRSLSLARNGTLRRSSQPAHRHLDGWLALQQAVVVPFSLQASRRAISSWLAQHPEHPAALIPPASISTLLDNEATPTHVALLLPLSGPLARAGESVRDGFIAASLTADASSWLTLSVYDAAAEPIATLYERMLADGADLIVGPLQKPAVSALRELNPELPVLALNYLDEDSPPTSGFSQFGLAIEDEARTIARRLQRDGVTRALLFHNYDDWSLRARRTLSASAAVEGSRLELTVQPFTDLRTITESVGTAMHVAGSQARRDELARLLGEELEFLPRAREDVDAVVALVDNTEANALVPALRFHFASDLPVYASSQTTRRARPGSLNELSGFHVSELPYFLAGDPVFATLALPFDLDKNPFASLIALGSDAFRITERLEPDGQLVLIGSTGLLRQQADGRINRELAWGTIAGGRVRGTAAQPASAVGADD
jgi:outer membrane PBP1 activator LpoA protein